MNNYQSFGKYPKSEHKEIKSIYWRNEIPNIANSNLLYLPYGAGKSYGDSCLNDGGGLIDCSRLNKFIAYDNIAGTITAEAGILLKDIIDLIIKDGWFLATTPGTKLITLGGAIANDVHGKNHHSAGTFGCHINKFELVRSNGERLICSKMENTDLYRAPIGGLGLTGIITWAEVQLIKVPSQFIDYEYVNFNSIDEFFEINSESESKYEFTVAWVDLSKDKKCNGRGVYIRGDFAEYCDLKIPKERNISFPFSGRIINNLTIPVFNTLYYYMLNHKKNKSTMHYNQFFYPLDAIKNWNRAYGKKGFLQYQFVLPQKHAKEGLKKILQIFSESGFQSFLTVLKTFGNRPSPGMLSFPKSGVTLAVDFPFLGQKTLNVLLACDRVLREFNGVVYPAKDARMLPEDFKSSFQNLNEFINLKDPKLSSSFWKRVFF